MAFTKGTSGNPNGRPRQTADQKAQKERFQALLRASTVDALQCIIQIAHDRHNNNRFNACKFIIDKAYGANTAFLLDGAQDDGPLIIEVRRCKVEEGEEWEQKWINDA